MRLDLVMHAALISELGCRAFRAYAAQVLEIQACMPAPPTTKKRMMSGVYIAYAIVAWCYLGVGFSGYAAFGQSAQSRDHCLTRRASMTAPQCHALIDDRSQHLRLYRHERGPDVLCREQRG